MLNLCESLQQSAWRSPTLQLVLGCMPQKLLSLQIFGLMNLIIDRLGDSIKPFANGLLGLFPQVWQDAEGQSLLRIQVCDKQTCVIRLANKISIVTVNSHNPI